MNSPQFLGWKVLPGYPRCRRQYPHTDEVIIRSGYFTKRGKKEIYVKPKTVFRRSKNIVNICGGRMVMDQEWKPTPEMDTWLTKWMCADCRTIEYINRAILPLSCGGLRE